MISDVRKLVSQADDLAHLIRDVAEQAKDTGAQRLVDNLLGVLAALKNKGNELVERDSSPYDPKSNTVRLTLTLNQTTIDLIEYLRSSQVADSLCGSIDICDETIDWHAAARFAKRAALPRPSLTPRKRGHCAS